MSSIDTLVPDIYKLLESKGVVASTDPEIFKKLGVEIGDLVHNRLAEASERVPSLRLSSIGRPLRQLWYELNAKRLGLVSEPLRGATIFKFIYGDVLEALVLTLAEAAGHSVTDRQREVSVDGVKGHIDAIIDGVLVDAKSCSPYSFNKFKTGALLSDDPFGYIGQISGYANSLKLDARFIAINKVSGEICVYEVPRKVIQEYDVQDRIRNVRTAVVQHDPPAKCYEDEAEGSSGNRKLSTGCSYCNHKMYCWADANDGRGLQVYLYSTGPKFLTRVVREPKVSRTDLEGFSVTEPFTIKE